MGMSVRFYAYEPPIPYPFHFTNVMRYKYFFRVEFKHGLLDCGVGVFRRGRDYPPGFLKRYEFIARQLGEIFGDRLWIVIPDYCDDYMHVPNNVEKTLRNIEYFSRIDGVEWLPVIQSRYLDVESFRKSCEALKPYRFEKLAIGAVCKTNNVEYIRKCCSIARRYFPNAWLHAFGLTLRALPAVRDLIDSFDSSAYTFPRGSGYPSCKDREMRIKYFKEYLERVNSLGIRQQKLDRFISS